MDIQDKRSFNGTEHSFTEGEKYWIRQCLNAGDSNYKYQGLIYIRAACASHAITVSKFFASIIMFESQEELLRLAKLIRILNFEHFWRNRLGGCYFCLGERIQTDLVKYAETFVKRRNTLVQTHSQ